MQLLHSCGLEGGGRHICMASLVFILHCIMAWNASRFLSQGKTDTVKLNNKK